MGIIVLCMLIVPAGCGKKPLQEANSVVVYCSVDQEISEPILAEFEKLSGVKVLARYDTEASKTVGLVARIRAESARPLADVFWSGEPFYTMQLAGEGLLQSYTGTATQSWPTQFADPQGRWYAFALRARAIAYNTQKISPDKAPKKLEDLLDPQWKGRLVMSRPEIGTISGDVASWFAHYGPQRAKEILQGLKANGLRLVDGNSTAVRMVATGQADVCMTDTDDVYVGKRNGWPIAMNLLDQGGAGCLVIPNTAGVIQGCPHPEMAAKLMEFLLSERLERLMAQSDAHFYPTHPSVASEFKAYAIPNPLSQSFQSIADAMPDAVRQAGETLR
jgi:iron(III) transport system substrate-binding protein